MIAAYVRVSTREQLQGYGIDAQEEKIKNYFKDIGISLEQVQFFRDPGVSAANKNRPAFESMMKFIRRNKITEVIIYKLDRLFRDLQQQIDVINEFKMRDVKLTCITEDLDLSSANGRLTTHMRGAIAEWERDTIRERTLDGLVQSAIEGNYSVDTPPFGYKRVNSKLEIIEEEAEIVRYGFEQKANGVSVPALVSIINYTNFKIKIKMTEDRLYRILKNKIYYGCFAYFGVELEDHSPAINDKVLWERANLNKQRSKVLKQHIFYTEVLCHRCETPCKIRGGTSKSGEVYYYYHCLTEKLSYSEKLLVNQFKAAYELYYKILKSDADQYEDKSLDEMVKEVTSLYVHQSISKEVYELSS